jgi:protein associated with RNAse G/E
MPLSDAVVNSRKFDGEIRRSWKCSFVERRDSLLIFVGEFDRSVSHEDLGEIAAGTTSYEYYWLDRWYNVFRFHQPDGSLRNYYCNINMPPRFENGVLDYVDLDIDIVIWPDGSVVTLDEEEFASNAAAYRYPEDVRENADHALRELRELIERGEFPFGSADA